MTSLTRGPKADHHCPIQHCKYIFHKKYIYIFIYSTGHCDRAHRSSVPGTHGVPFMCRDVDQDCHMLTALQVCFKITQRSHLK